MVIGTGNVGIYLSHRPDEVNTYLSRNGGLTWFEIRKGSHIYEMGNHGGLIVMAKNREQTNEFLYSWDEGLTWEIYKIDKKILVSNILVEPSNKSLKFIVYGKVFKESKHTHTEIVVLDFSSLH